MTTHTFTVPDISCGHCKESIEKAVGAIEGVESVDVEIEPKTVEVGYDESATTIEAITDAVEEIGYEVPREG